MTDKKLSDFTEVTAAEVSKLPCLYLDQNNANKNGLLDFAAYDVTLTHIAGTETITGNKTFSGSITFSGSATFNNDLNTNITGQAEKANKDADGNVISTTYGKLAGANTWTAANTYSSSVDLGSAATVTEPSATDSSTRIVNSSWVANHRCKTKATTTSSASVNAPAYVTENYFNSSNGDWYRIWSDGWIEQGGYQTGSGSGRGYKTITFLKPFNSTQYTATTSYDNGSSATNNQGYYSYLANKTKTTIQISTYSGHASFWYACGY